MGYDEHAALDLACERYRRCGNNLAAGPWLKGLGLPDYTWAGTERNPAVQLFHWRLGGRFTRPPLLFMSSPNLLSCALVVLAAAALGDRGRDVPEELLGLATVVLASGAVWWEQGYPP